MLVQDGDYCDHSIGRAGLAHFFIQIIFVFVVNKEANNV